VGNFSGVGVTYAANGVTMRIRPTGVVTQGFNPAQRMAAGEEFEISYNIVRRYFPASLTCNMVSQ
jgi:hypothetical protein